MRKTYKELHIFLDVDTLPSKDPFVVFGKWFEDAMIATNISEPNAMTLATASKDGIPSARVVLLKSYDKNGFRFFTNYESRKGRELAENPFASLLFYWTKTPEGDSACVWSRQVRIVGTVEKLTEEESTEYFHSRPHGSQIGATVSNQSRVIKSRQELRNKEEKLMTKYSDESITVPKPDYWGGYLVKPTEFEFWQGGGNRLHDRLVFRKHKKGEEIDVSLTHDLGNGWLLERLSP